MNARARHLVIDKVTPPNGKPLTPEEVKWQLVLLTQAVNRLIEVVSDNHVVAEDVTQRKLKRAGMIAAGMLAISLLSVFATVLAIRGHLV